MIPIQFIIHTNWFINSTEVAEQALEGGCRWIRLHFEETYEVDKKTLALQIQKLCKEHGATFMIDDEVTLCKDIEADGVHLSDVSLMVKEVREVLGHEFIIGASARTFDDVKRHKCESADYVCCDLPKIDNENNPWKEFETIIQQMQSEELRIPLCAMGDIELTDILPLLDVGIQGFALDQTIYRSGSIIATMRQFLNADE